VLDHVILQRIGINDTVKENVGVVEPQFTYNFSSRKGKPAPVLTQDKEQTPPKPLPTPEKDQGELMNQPAPICGHCRGSPRPIYG
jgi:hypothetical protein